MVLQERVETRSEMYQAWLLMQVSNPIWRANTKLGSKVWIYPITDLWTFEVSFFSWINETIQLAHV